MAEKLRLMAVHAHPDDESSKGAATMARYVAEGHDVMVATCTGGERGSILNPAMDRPDVLANMAEIRREEMATAAKILGIEHLWLGFVDSGLPEGDPKPPLPEGCFALVPLERVAPSSLVAWCASSARTSSTPTTSAAATRTPTTSCATRSRRGLRRRRRPGPSPRGRPAVADAQAVLLPRLPLNQDVAFHEACRPGLDSPYGEWLAGLEPDPARRTWSG